MCDDDSTFFASPVTKRPSLVTCTNTRKDLSDAAISGANTCVVILRSIGTSSSSDDAEFWILA